MINVKKIMSLVLALTMLVLVTACGEKKVDSKKIVMGTFAEFPPFEYREGNKIIGFDIELMKAIAKETGYELEIKDLSFDGLIPALQSKRIDVIAAGMTITEDRKKNVNFSNGYYEANLVIIKRTDNNDIKKPEDLKGKKIGVQLGTTGNNEAQKIEKAKVKQFDAAVGAVMDLKSRKIDAIILDSEPAKNFVKRNEGLVLLKDNLTKENYALAFRRSDTVLLEEFNGALEKLKSNGEYDKLIEKYFAK